MKKSFILYKDNYELINSLSNENAGKLFKKIYDYEHGVNNNYGELIETLFLTIKKGLDENSLKYEEKCEKNKQNVLKRWAEKNTTVYDRIQTNTKYTDTDTDTDTDTELSKDNIKEKNIKKKYGEFNNVLLKEEELEKLKDKYKDWENKIEKLSLYIESKGIKYKSHYATIISWSKKDKPAEEIVFRKEDNIFERKEQDERNKRFRI